MTSPIGVGVVGLGFMGAVHIRAFRAAGAMCRLVAVSDRDPARLGGCVGVRGNLGRAEDTPLFDPADVQGYTDPPALLADPAVQAVSICTHTDTHVELAIAAMRAGKRVLVEKPVALASTDVARVAAVARETGLVCMPAMCMRFWPEWVWLRSAIRSRAYGAVRSASFQRLGSVPAWTDFYRDTTRSGGALFDLHIHDADFIRWCFGEPESVACVGSRAHGTRTYTFGDLRVTAEFASDRDPALGFCMRYRVEFERATAEFDLSRSPPLLVSIPGQAQPAAPVPAGVPTAYEAEVRAFLGAIMIPGAAATLPATIDDAVLTARLLESELARLPASSAPFSAQSYGPSARSGFA